MGCIPPFPIHIQTLVSHADAQTLAGSYINFPIAGSIICVGGLKPTLQDLLLVRFGLMCSKSVNNASGCVNVGFLSFVQPGGVVLNGG